jgi:tetratricopeptide (TPR) repeat protein
MRRTLNLKFFLGLILTVAVLGVGVHFAHSFQVKRSARVLRQRAFQETDPDKQTALLERFLRFQPGDAEAQEKFALLLSDQAKAPRARLRAFLELDQAVRLNPDRDDLRRRCIEIAMSVGRFDEAKDHLEILLSAGPDGELQDLHGQCEEAKGDYKKARDDYEKARKMAPKQVDTYVRLANLLQSRFDQETAAQGIMKEMIDRNPDSPRAVIHHSRHLKRLALLEATKPEEAKKHLSNAEKELNGVKAEREEEKTGVLVVLAEVAIARSQLEPKERLAHIEKARGYYKKGMREHKENLLFPFALVELDFRAGRPKDALESLFHIQKILDSSSTDNLDAIGTLADLFFEANEPEEAEKEINKLRGKDVRPGALNYLKARLLISEGLKRNSTRAFAEATDLLEKSREELKANVKQLIKADILLGQCYEQLGNPDQRLAAFERAAKADPSSGAARFGYAAALLAVGDLENGLIEYRKLMKLLPDEAEPRLTVARLLMFQNLQQGKENWDGVKSVLEETPKELGDKLQDMPEFRLLKVDLLLARKETADAMKELERAPKKVKEDVRYWLAKAVLKAREKPETRVEEALRVLADAERDLGDRVELRLARAQWLTRKPLKEKKEVEEVRGELKKLEHGADKLTEENKIRLMLGLAEAYNRSGSPENAERLLQRAKDQRKNDLGIRIQLFDLASQQGDLKAMKGLVSDLREIEGPNGVLWRYAQAARWVSVARRKNEKDRTEELATASKLLDPVAKSRPSWSRVPLLQAEIAELGGEDPIDLYVEAITKGERRDPVIARTLWLLSQKGRFPEAQEVLRKVQGPNPLAPDIAKLATQVLLNQDPAAVTEDLINQAANSKSIKHEDWLLRGQLHWATSQRPGQDREQKEKQIKNARDAFQKAVDLEPKKAVTWVSLAHFLIETDRKKEAEAKIEEMKKALPTDQLALGLAGCYEFLGQRDSKMREKAELEYKHYLDILKGKPEERVALRIIAVFYLRTDPTKAEPHLESLINNGTEADVVWARRALALALAASGDFQKSKKAMALIKKNLDRSKPMPEDERAKALVLAMRPGGRHGSIEALEGSFDRLPPTPAEEFLIAQLYEADSKWRRAKERLRSLASRKGGNPVHLAYYIRALIRHEEVDEAEAWLRRLQEIESRTLATLELEARVLKARTGASKKDIDKAIDAVRDYLLKEYEKNKDARVLGVGAALLDSLEGDPEHPEADRPRAKLMYETYVEKTKTDQPGNILVMAAFHANRQHLDKAMELCEEAWRLKVAPDRVAAVSVSILRVTRKEPEEPRWRQAAGRVEDKIEKAAGANAAYKEALMVALADLYDARKEYRKSIEQYEKILRINERNVVALNNRAWLLMLSAHKPDDALNLVNEAVSNFGDLSNLLDTRGMIYLNLGQPKKAIGDLEKAVADIPTATRWYHLARAYKANGDQRKFEDALKQARDLKLNKSSLHPLEVKEYNKFMAEIK